jgi:hypothetical protein
MSNVNRRLVVTFSPIIVILCLMLLDYLSHHWYLWLIVEDGLIEYATSLAYLAASGISVVASRYLIREDRAAHAVLVLGFAGMCLLVAMEEISWGQRIIGFGTPDWFAKQNTQGELTLHNLGGFQRSWLSPAYMFIGFAGSIGALLVSSKIKNKWPDLSQLLLPSRQLFFYFFPAFAFYLGIELIHPITRGAMLDWLRSLIGTNDYSAEIHESWIHQEPVEFILAIGFLGLALQILDHVRKSPGGPGANGIRQINDGRADLARSKSRR